MKNFIAALACLGLVSTTLIAKSHPVPQREFQKEPAVPARVVSEFNALVEELILLHFGPVSYETSVNWVHNRGRWISEATITVSRSSGLFINAIYKQNGCREGLNYFLL